MAWYFNAFNREYSRSFSNLYEQILKGASMKRNILFLTACLFLMANTVCAHPPTNIEIEYNPSDKTVLVIATHPVKDPQNHYIKTIDLVLNGKEIAAEKFHMQLNKITQRASFVIKDAKSGDALIADADCSLFGSLAKEIKIP